MSHGKSSTINNACLNATYVSMRFRRCRH